MVTADPVPEWRWILNQLMYALAILVVRWLMPQGIREACCRGEIQMLRESFPDKWGPVDAYTFEEAKAQIKSEYRMEEL